MTLDALEDWAGALLARLQPTARRQLLTRLARDLRRSQQQRIRQQLNPDGGRYERRKPKPRLRARYGQIKARMFTRLRLAKHLKANTDDRGLSVGFGGRAGKIARVHQFGERDRPAPGQAMAAYPARQLLGLTAAELDHIRAALLQHLSEG
ncbi:phage virion morphogenesis protein [Pseudomonas japonica]|uniref:phage virion morphogenesis protein n=1 Tax=Pseudomonas japonica TaxID=256466 RepID=UPI0015E3823F|nr:phage virion morphogenesis protein [Pseudomonas japonica]MBA1289180.1 phage virion morphogenesis protein [Pseudomonas japonica]